MTHFRSHRLAGAALTAFALFVTAVAAQPPRPDPLEAARAQQKIADQKATAAVDEAILAADRAMKNRNPAKAAQLLKEALRDIDQAVAISGEARKTLTASLTARIAVAEGRPVPNPNPGPKLDPKGAEVKAAQKAAVERYLAELKDVNAGIDRVKYYQAKGDTATANAEIAKLAAAYPNNPAVIVLGQNGSIKSRIDDAVAFHKVQNDRMWAVQKGIMESSLPAVRDVEFPKDWKDKDRRLKTVELTAKEKKIMEALDKPISVAFNDRPLEEALQDISNAFDQPLLVDKKSLEDLLVDLKKGVSLNAKGLSGRTVLRSILATQGLTFIVKDETIQVVTLEKAKSTLTTRVYYLGDLINGVGPFGDFRFGPFLNLAQTQESVRVLTETITKSVDPLSWKENGGAGTVTFHVPSMSLIVRASTEVHFALGKSFGGGR
ncbi:MAG: hypothetical protein J0I06_25990 [Planctomycetes bacterium]|nr:hypothetical protein [Planctomycetota bacterium]